MTAFCPSSLAGLLFFCVMSLATGVESRYGNQCMKVKSRERLDCYPEAFASELKCLARGCCWRQPDMLQHEVAPPTCFFPPNYPAYSVISKKETSRGFKLEIQKLHPENVYSEEFRIANLDITYETETRVRLRFTDPRSARWEPPIPLGPPEETINEKRYSVQVEDSPLGVQIARNNKTLVEFSRYLTTALILSNQFLQVTFKINAHFGYGLGERRVNFPLELHKWDRAGMWNRDMPPVQDSNLYGNHNFFLGVDEEGEAFGIFLLNSNAQEVAVQPLPALTYRTTGGILDFFVFVGPSPKEVVAQYLKLIGKPMIPPYWSLGFHLCRYGYSNMDNVKEVLERNRAAKIPIDVQWLDIDYMDAQKDWTFDAVNFPYLSDFVSKDLHEDYGMKSVIIVDPAINIIEGYGPYEKGVEMGIFVNDSRTGKPIIGQVWPGDTLFPDFSHPRIHEWWTTAAVAFHEKVSFDGLWIDMNEPSNFVDGSKTGCINDSPLDNPPYVPQLIGGTLYSKTLCPSATHFNNSHYNLHNLYGYFEAQVTHKTLDTIFPGKRQFLLSRSTTAGSGRYTFHWTGDNFSSWNDLLASIAQVINFNIFGIPMVGADICGFNGQSTDELCLRWSQLGAFYPFSRNHNTINSRPQDPAFFSDETIKAIRDVIRFRYFILPYMYTLMHKANQEGSMVVLPLSFEFPDDVATQKINDQFMLGQCILVSPVTEEGLTSVYAYLPKGDWVSAADTRRISSNGSTFVIAAPLEIIPVHFRAGCAIPLQKPELTTALARKNGLGALLILRNQDFGQTDLGIQASGELIWDDGETLDQAYLLARFELINRELRSSPRIFASSTGMDFLDPVNVNVTMDFILLSGLKKKPSAVVSNGQKALTFIFDDKRSTLKIFGDGILSWAHPFSIEYTI